MTLKDNRFAIYFPEIGFVTGAVDNIKFTSEPTEALFWEQPAAQTLADAFGAETGKACGVWEWRTTE